MQGNSKTLEIMLIFVHERIEKDTLTAHSGKLARSAGSLPSVAASAMAVADASAAETAELRVAFALYRGPQSCASRGRISDDEK